ncbi:MAG: lysophospholipid acyltransferase family protein [Phycisphaerales bacterium]
MNVWAWVIPGLGSLCLCAAWALLIARRTGIWAPHDLAVQILGRAYARFLHDLRVEGREHIPQDPSPGPLIVVANHTAGVDPILVAAACQFDIRWVMAQDMRLPWLGWFWRWQEVIFVSRSGQDRGAVREALAHLERGGVIGIFPEGGLERPARQIRRFRRGVGLLIHRSRAPVLPVVIEGTPQVDPAWASLWRRGRARVTAHEIVDYAESGLSGVEIADDLRRRYLDWTGWPANDRSQREADVTHPPRLDVLDEAVEDARENAA